MSMLCKQFQVYSKFKHCFLETSGKFFFWLLLLLAKFVAVEPMDMKRQL